jgi:hypothetical protein
MRIRKSVAGIAAGALAVAGIGVIAAPAASASPSSGTQTGTQVFTSAASMYCWVDGISSSAALWPRAGQGPSTVTVTTDPNPGPDYTKNQSATVTVDFTAGPGNGPFGVSQTANFFVRVLLDTDNNIGNGYESVGPVQSLGITPAYAVAANATTSPGKSVTGTVNLGASVGETAIEFYGVQFLGTVTDPGPFLGSSSTTYCNGDSTNPLASFTGAEPKSGAIGVKAAFLTLGETFSISSVSNQAATAAGRAGDTITVTGSRWGADGAVTAVTVGGVAGDNSTLAVSGGAGALSGSVDVGATAPAGVSTVAITKGALSSSVPFTVLGNRTANSSATSGSPGNVISVSGSNFDTGDTVNITQLDSSNNVLDSDTATASATGPAFGSFSQSITVSAGLATIRVREADGDGVDLDITFTANKDACVAEAPNGSGGFTATTCETEQTVSATVLSGDLRQALGQKTCTVGAALGGTFEVDSNGPAPGGIISLPLSANCTAQNSGATSINLGAITTPVTSSKLGAFLNTTTVTDTRGIVDGWTVTATIDGPLTSLGGATIGVDKMVLGGITCASNAIEDPDGPGPQPGVDMSAPVTVGGGGVLTSAVTLCTQSGATNAATDTSGGRWLIDGKLQVTVPAFQAAGDYSATLTTLLV